MLRKIPLIEGQYFHIFNKGVDGRDIYVSDRDYARFWLAVYFLNDSSMKPVRLERVVDYYFNTTGKFLELASSVKQHRTPFVQISAYCLMPSHFHLLLKGLVPDGISKFLQRIEGSHANYFNKLYKRKGSLFTGAFRAELVRESDDLANVACYIHANPLSLFDSSWKEGSGIRDLNTAIKFLEDYKWSSFNDYFSGNDEYELKIVDKKDLLNYFGDNNLHYKFIADWIKKGDVGNWQVPGT